MMMYLSGYFTSRNSARVRSMARLLFLVLLVSWTSGLAPSKRGQGYQISPRACSVGGHPGVCMFVWECIRHEGEHLGMCMDAFMFGSCCQLPANVTVPTEAALTGPSSAVSTYISQQQHATRPNIIPGRPSTKRPPRPPPKPTTEWFRPQYSTTERLRPQYSTTERFRPQYSSTERYRPTTERYRPTTERYRPTTERYRPTTERYRPTTERHRPSATSTERHPSTEEHHTSESFQVSVSTPAESKSTERTPASWGTTEPAFVTRTKPPLGSTTTSWGSSPFRPRPPDFVAGSLSNQQRPQFSKPTTPGYVTKKPSRPSSPSNEFITSSTKFPGKPGEITKRPFTTPEPPALLDFVTLSTKRPTPVPVTEQEKPTTAVQIVRPTTVVMKPTSTTTPVITTSKPTSTQSTPPAVTSTTQVAQQSTRPNAAARKECGVPPLFPRPEMRIVGGSAAPFGGWPWQVSVRRTSFFGFSSTHRCGGAVLNENWIATAGHCVDDLLTSQIRIRVGEYDFSSAGEPLAHEERGVLRKVVHPRYNFFTYEYDLALVQLDKPLDFAPHVAPICLPGSDDSLVGETATVTGWGRLSEGGTLPSVLQEVSVPIVSNEKCKSMFLRAGRHEHIPEIFLCAGFEDGGRDSCQGDSGGPLQVRGKDGRYFLAGIISWGIGCAESNLPGVCTRISKFVPWIMENVT